MPPRGRSVSRSGSRTTCRAVIAEGPSGSDDPADQVVVVCLRDPHAYDLAGRDVAAAGVVDEETAVDLGGLRRQKPLEEVLRLLAGALDDRLDGPSDERPALLPRDRPLERKEKIPSTLLLLRGHPVAQRLGGRSRLGRIRECPDVVELRAADELAQLAELGFSFTGEADDERRADRDVRHDLAHPVDHRAVEAGVPSASP